MTLVSWTRDSRTPNILWAVIPLDAVGIFLSLAVAKEDNNRNGSECRDGLLRRTNDCSINRSIIMRIEESRRFFLVRVTKNDVVVKIADHSETSDYMGQGMAEQAPRNVANGVKNFFELWIFSEYATTSGEHSRGEFEPQYNSIVLEWKI